MKEIDWKEIDDPPEGSFYADNSDVWSVLKMIDDELSSHGLEIISYNEGGSEYCLKIAKIE